MALLSVTASTLETYLRDAKKDEKEEKKSRLQEVWLDCTTDSWLQLAEQVATDDKTAKK